MQVSLHIVMNFILNVSYFIRKDVILYDGYIIEGGFLMKSIIPIKGAVTYTLTLDPTVWIFDDRTLRFNNIF